MPDRGGDAERPDYDWLYGEPRGGVDDATQRIPVPGTSPGGDRTDPEPTRLLPAGGDRHRLQDRWEP
ncbi:MAG: hypothetical protein M3P83_02095, partial [Actinomycetota bacterium]|nr:hypothetical protein [Actinomycetota bacterium]